MAKSEFDIKVVIDDWIGGGGRSNRGGRDPKDKIKIFVIVVVVLLIIFTLRSCGYWPF
jgi:hypothetical protein